MWIISIFLLFLSTPQVFPKFILILTPVKTGVSGFANQTIRFCKSDYPVLVTGYVRPLHWIPVSFLDLSGNLLRHVRSLSKNLKLDQNLPF
jgi:hypothetical protein